MAQLSAHLAQYQTFARDAKRTDLSPALRVEALFLASYHLIDACAARSNVHIGKHQNVRRELEANPEIFGDSTKKAWQAFQELETRIRPKFMYGQSSRKEDLDLALTLFGQLEEIAKEILEQ